MDENLRDERVRERAYQLWEEAGSPEGGAEDFWYQAKRLIEEEEASSSPDPSELSGDKP